MAYMSSYLSEEQLRCAICLDVFTDPIATPCGHNYCQSCINYNWDTNGLSQCPLCAKQFGKRPEVSVPEVSVDRPLISEMTDQFRKSQQQPAEPDEVSCDVCTETKHKASKSCLVCLTSYCETHLERHQTVTALKRHKLINPVKNLEDFICKKHDRPLELFCKTDHMCVCQFCTESDHKLHQIVSLKEECEGKKAELRKTEAEVQQMIKEKKQKIQEVKHSVELNKKEVDKRITDTCMQFFTALTSCFKNHRTTEKQAEGFIKELENEIAELEKRSCELKHLSYTEDHLHLLQNFTSIKALRHTKDGTKVNPSYVGTVRTAVAQLEKTISQEMAKLYDAELRSIQRHAANVTLDPDTAHCELILSEDGKQVNYGGTENRLPDSTERFSRCIFVLGKQRVSSGIFYYEVQVKGKNRWHLGVARESINRKGDITLNPNNGYWTMSLRDEHVYWAGTDPPVLLPVRKKLQKVGVFVDYEEGLVSFYDVEARDHIYSFTGCTFTEKLYPLFCPGVNDHGKNSAPLIVSPVKHTQSNIEVQLNQTNRFNQL